jgi:hypothetical protein
VRKPEGKRTLGGPRRRWEIILKWILMKGEWTTFTWLRIGTIDRLL